MENQYAPPSVMDLGDDSQLVARYEIDSELRAWLHDGGQILHVEGPPGFGKTCWIELLAAAKVVCDNDGQVLARVVAHHFCRRDDARSASSIAFLESVASQLANSEPRFAQVIAERSGHRRGLEIQVTIDLSGTAGANAVGIAAGQLIIQASSPADLLHEIVVPLEALVEDAETDWLIAVDAPDEATEGGLADLLLALGQMPKRLRWIITSRSGTRFAGAMASTDADRLDLTVVCERSISVARFLSERVKATGLLRRLAQGQEAQEFLDALGERVGDNFLIAARAVEALAAEAGALNLASIARLPRTLQGYFLRLLQRLPKQLHDAWATESGLILGSLAVAKAPLPEPDLVQITSLSQSIVRDRLTRLQPFMRKSAGGWRVFHATFAEFLLDSDQACEFWCPECEQHERFLAWISRSTPSKAPAYALDHFVNHAISAAGESMLQRLDRAIEPAFLAARFANGSSLYAVDEDFRRMLAATSESNDVPRTLFLLLAMTLWQRKAADTAASASTTFLAATGQIRAASALALRQEAAGSSDYEAMSQRARYAVSLVALNEIDEALSFAANADAGTNWHMVFAAVIDAMAVQRPSLALEALSRIPVAEWPKSLSEEACRALASVPDCVQTVLPLATTTKARLAMAEGCAQHNLVDALALVRDSDFSFFHIRLGGDKLSLSERDAVLRVLLAFLQTHPDQVDFVWNIAKEQLGEKWPEPFGFLLAAAFASIDRNRGAAAYQMLGLGEFGLQPAIAASWIGAIGGDALLQELSTHPGTPIPAGVNRGEREIEWQLLIMGIQSALPMLELIEPHRVARQSEAFSLLKSIGDTLLDALELETDVPEYKEQVSYGLGRLFAWLDMSQVERLRRLALEGWRITGHELGKGVAIGLASQSVEAYLAEERNGICPECWYEHALIAAGEMIAKRDPESIVKLIDRVPERYSTARAELVGIAAVETRRAGLRISPKLSTKLTPFTRSAWFLFVLEGLRKAYDALEDESEAPDAVRLNQLVLTAVEKGDTAGLLDMVPDVEQLTQASSAPYRGAYVWAKEVRRNLAAALQAVDPVRALRVHPVSDEQHLESLVRLILSSYPEPNVQHAFDAYQVVVHVERNEAYGMWRCDVSLAFARILPPRLRKEFVDLLPVQEAELITEVLEGIDDPIAAFHRLASCSKFYCLWVARKFIAELCRKDEKSTFAALDTVAATDWARMGSLVGCVGEQWPITQWRRAIDAFLDWTSDKRLSPEDTRTYAESFLEELLSRVVRNDAATAFAVLHTLPKRISTHLDLSILQRRLVEAGANASRCDDAQFAALVEATIAIEDDDPRKNAVHSLLDGLRHVSQDAQRRCCCLVLKAVGLKATGSNPLWEVDSWVYAALRAEPGLQGNGESMATRLQALLEVELPMPTPV